ncbi:MAG: tyrosine-type recombinase/integrase [Syntrophobacteraceae bacterium]
MATMTRHKTKYEGVTFVWGTGVNGKPEEIFYIRYRKGGRQIEEKAGRHYQDDMTAARANAIRTDRIRGRDSSNEERREEARREKWTIARLWQEYKAQHPLRGIAQDESRYRLYLEATFGSKEPVELVSLDIDRLRVKLLKSKSPQTVKNVLALLRRIIRFGQNKGLCDGPKFIIQMPAKINNVRTEDLTDEELSRLLAALDEDPDIQATNLMRLALVSGMRRGELFRLQWSHVDFENGFIHLKDPKGGRDAVIPMNDSARSVLENHPRAEGSLHVFPGRGGNQRVEIRDAVNRIKRKAGLPEGFRPLHGLRHTFASSLASSGQVDLYTLQRLLTHKDPAMTQRYAHLRDEALRKASDLAGNLVQQAAQIGKQEPTLKLLKSEG